MPPPPGKTYNDLRAVLEENVRVIDADLSEGSVPADTDMLLLAPRICLKKQSLLSINSSCRVVLSSSQPRHLTQALAIAVWLLRLTIQASMIGLSMGFTIKSEMVLDHKMHPYRFLFRVSWTSVR